MPNVFRAPMQDWTQPGRVLITQDNSYIVPIHKCGSTSINKAHYEYWTDKRVTYEAYYRHYSKMRFLLQGRGLKDVDVHAMLRHPVERLLSIYAQLFYFEMEFWKFLEDFVPRHMGSDPHLMPQYWHLWVDPDTGFFPKLTLYRWEWDKFWKRFPELESQKENVSNKQNWPNITAKQRDFVEQQLYPEDMILWRQDDRNQGMSV